MKKLIMSAMLFASPLPGAAWDLSFPSLQEQYEAAKIDEVTQIFQNDPYFAGKIVNIEMFGKKVAVDRTGEPNTTPPGTPPPSASGSLASLTEILDGLQAGAKGQVEINVERKWSESGVLQYEKWGIVVGGQYNVKKEKLAPEKEGKTTGE
jgi:hypothetical protein